jgi:GH43 family beta-xylosidase
VCIYGTFWNSPAEQLRIRLTCAVAAGFVHKKAVQFKDAAPCRDYDARKREFKMRASSTAIMLVFMAFGLIPAARLNAEPPTPFVNPLLPRHADPWIYRHSDGFYYFSSTVPEYDRIELRKSTTIAGLASAPPVTVWKKHLSGDMAANIWAPELHYIDGAWYVYFAAGSSSSPYDVRPYVLENESPDPLIGTWTERGRIRTAWDTISLDATTFACAGVRYLVCAQRQTRDMGGPLNLYIAPLSNPWTITGPQVMISAADREWELRKRRTNEGPCVLQRNGKIFLAYSANYVDATYCIGMLTASADSDLLDPGSWTKSAGPVFDSNPGARIWGPGHNSFTTSPDGSVDYLVYHARSSNKVSDPAILDPNRHTRVQPFSWGADGNPVFGSPLPDTTDIR